MVIESIKLNKFNLETFTDSHWEKIKYNQMKKYIYFKTLLFTMTMVISSNNFSAQCITGCNTNTYLNSADPNTLEYDNVISAYHGTIVREADNKIYLWGEKTAANGTGDLTAKTELSAANGYIFNGTILRMATGGSGYGQSQYTILTTTGLYIWGERGYLYDSSFGSSNALQTVAIGTAGVSGGATKADGLPAGVSPSQVKMLFGSYKTLGLVTCTGDAWILSGTGDKNGDGTSESSTNNKLWHRVKTGAGTDLSNVVTMRGSALGMMALTSIGEVYTWGTNVYLGNGSAPASQTYAKKMTLPAGITPRQIGMTQNGYDSAGSIDPNPGVSYYIVSSTNKLYSLGQNDYRQLGDFTATNQTSWVRVKEAAGTDMRDIAWISPQEHDEKYAYANALTTTGKLFSWGHNNENMIGGAVANGPTDPIFMTGNLPNTPSDVYMAVESGGHATIIVRKCSNNFGYIGHRVNGSMATTGSGYESVYTFTTATLNLCGAAVAPAINSILRICNGTNASLSGAFTGTVPAGSQLKFFTNSALTVEVPNPASVGPGTYYAAFIETGPLACPNPPYTTIVVQYYVPGDAGYSTCACYNNPNSGTSGVDTKQGITLLTRAGTDNGNWPMIRKSAHTVLESNIKGFVVTRMTTTQITAITFPQEGMMVYDTDLKCLKLYDGTTWSCFNTPACP